MKQKLLYTAMSLATIFLSSLEAMEMEQRAKVIVKNITANFPHDFGIRISSAGQGAVSEIRYPEFGTVKGLLHKSEVDLAIEELEVSCVAPYRRSSGAIDFKEIGKSQTFKIKDGATYTVTIENFTPSPIQDGQPRNIIKNECQIKVTDDLTALEARETRAKVIVKDITANFPHDFGIRISSAGQGAVSEIRYPEFGTVKGLLDKSEVDLAIEELEVSCVAPYRRSSGAIDFKEIGKSQTFKIKDGATYTVTIENFTPSPIQDGQPRNIIKNECQIKVTEYKK